MEYEAVLCLRVKVKFDEELGERPDESELISAAETRSRTTIAEAVATHRKAEDKFLKQRVKAAKTAEQIMKNEIKGIGHQDVGSYVEEVREVE